MTEERMYIIYGGRAQPGTDTDDASILCHGGNTLDETLDLANDWDDWAIWSYKQHADGFWHDERFEISKVMEAVNE